MSESVPKPSSFKSKIMSNFVWPLVFVIGFALVVAVLTIATSGPRNDHKEQVEMTYGVTVDRMTSSVLNDSIRVTRKSNSLSYRCSLPSLSQMKRMDPMKCTRSGESVELKARGPV